MYIQAGCAHLNANGSGMDGWHHVSFKDPSKLGEVETPIAPCDAHTRKLPQCARWIVTSHQVLALLMQAVSGGEQKGGESASPMSQAPLA